MKKNKITAEELKKSFENFFIEHRRFPTVLDIDVSKHFAISSRQIQRSFGGVINFRKSIGLIEDHRSGNERTKTLKRISDTNIVMEDKMQKLLETKYETRNIHRNVPIYDDSKSNIDFRVYTNNSGDRGYYIDVFHPSTFRSLKGCVNHKIKHYSGAKIEIPILLVSMNDDITQEEIEKFVKSKDGKVPKNFRFYSYKFFKESVI